MKAFAERNEMNGRIHTRVTTIAAQRLDHETALVRFSSEVDRVSKGRILTDLIMGKYPQGLPPCPAETGARKLPNRKRPARAVASVSDPAA